MRIERVVVECRGCGGRVGVIVNAERYTIVEDQHPWLVPLCKECVDICSRFDVQPGWLRRLRDGSQHEADRMLGALFGSEPDVANLIATLAGRTVRRGGLER